MIFFRFAIRSPCQTNWKEIFSWSSGVFWKTKAIEVDFSSGNELLNLAIDIRFRGCDHAGPEFVLCIFGYELGIRLYDVRHWDYDACTWEIQQPQQTEERD